MYKRMLCLFLLFLCLAVTQADDDNDEDRIYFPEEIDGIATKSSTVRASSTEPSEGKGI